MTSMRENDISTMAQAIVALAPCEEPGVFIHDYASIIEHAGA